jgi:CheY-like chemotaxis protein
MAGKLKILCVDDDADILFVTGLSLGLDPDISVTEARSGADALDLLERGAESFDCVLLDVKMFGLSGMDVLSRMRALERHDRTPVIFLTAGVREGDLKAYLAGGALGVITKPYDPLGLAAELRRILATAAASADPQPAPASPDLQ